MTKRHQPGLADLLESFFRDRLMRQQRVSPATLSTYQDALRLLVTFAAARTGRPPQRLLLEDLDRDVVLAFLDHLETERGNSIRTRNVRLAPIRTFFQHVAASDPARMGLAQRVLAIPNKRTPKRVLEYLPHRELDAVLAAPDRATPIGRRDYALLLLLARTGARVSEAVGINAADLRLEAPYQVLLRGKGAKERVVPLGKDTQSALRMLCTERALVPTSTVPVFVNARGARLTRFGVIHLLDRAVAHAAHTVPDLARRAVSPHTLRHTAAMHLLQAGVDLSVIRSWLGHVSIDTTHGYLEADIEMKRRALEMCGAVELEAATYHPTDGVLALLKRRLELCYAPPPPPPKTSPPSCT
jgi:site-specific recombinase XerD